jgi:hypothetical protein
MSEQQLNKLVASLVEHQRAFDSMPSDDRQWVIQNTKDAIALFTQAVRHRTKMAAVVPDIFRLTIDYSQSLEQMIAAGRYDWTNSGIIAKHFPIEGKGTIEYEAKLFHFNRNISPEKAIEAMKKAGFEPATIEHLLAFAEKYSEEQRKYPIIGLGSVAEVDGARRVPYLRRIGSRRGLDLVWFDGDWDSDCRFLAVRKVSES